VELWGMDGGSVPLSMPLSVEPRGSHPQLRGDRSHRGEVQWHDATPARSHWCLPRPLLCPHLCCLPGAHQAEPASVACG
jgi:hypothetical protein